MKFCLVTYHDDMANTSWLGIIEAPEELDYEQLRMLAKDTVRQKIPGRSSYDSVRVCEPGDFFEVRGRQ